MKFEINNIDCLSKINSSIQISENNNQFKFLVKNIYPINEVEIFDECTIFNKTQCKVHLQNFYQYHALIFPCRDYTLEIVLKNHNNKYYLALATNEFFNVNNYVERTQYRDKHICNINYIDWLLPGSGYSFTIQKIDEEDQNKNIEDEEFYESIFDNHKSDEYRLSYSSDPSVAILTTEEAYVKLSRRNGNVTDYDAKLAMCVLDRLHQLLPKDIDNELLLLRGVWNNDQSADFLIYVDYIYDDSINPRFSKEELEELLTDDYEGIILVADVKCIPENFNSDYFFPNSKKYYDIINTIPLHSPERMTVNHDVTGSSPVGGAMGLSQMSKICNSPYFFDRLSFSKNEILKKLKISSMAYALIQRVDKISILFFRIVYFS